MTEAPAHLLVVDGDETLRALLRRYLSRNGYLVSVARDAAHARRILGGLAFDLLIVEAAMEGEDGRAFAAAIRDRMAAPVLLLTPRDATDEGDDVACLSKPFEPRDLLRRVGDLLEGAAVAPRAAPPRTLTLGEVRYDIGAGALWRGAEPVRLTASESALLRLLAGAAHSAVGRATLVAGLGGLEGHASERAVDVQMTRLRRKIEADPRNPRYIRTVRGEGYMLTPD
jgi:two-component system phosphate regulon response regulator OmpR